MPKFFSLVLGAALASLFWWGWPFPWPWTSDKFLGPDDFVGVPASFDPIELGYQSTFNGIVTFNNVDKDLVSELVPTDYELADRSTSELPDKHPIVLLFGDQTDGAGVVSGDPVYPYNDRIHYSEIILLIPFVKKSGDPTGQWHNYVARMYLDHTVPLGGGIFYGYKKLPAIINWAGQDAHAREALPWGSDLLNGSFKWFGTWHSGTSALANLPNFDDTAEILATGILGDHRWLDKRTCSNWEWSLEDARIAKVSASYSMEKKFRSEMSSWLALSPFTSEDNSAFFLKGVRWRLAEPKDC